MAPVPGAPIVQFHNQGLRKGLLLLAVVLGIGFLLIGGPLWSDGHWLHEPIEWIGLGLIVICITGRTWASLYIGGNKNQTLVALGPYSITRNPLYLFSIIGAVGVGAQVGSVTMAALCGFIAWAVFLRTARREEAELAVAFGDSYRRYCALVPRFWPKPALWNAPETIEVRPRNVVATFIDALIFLAAIPLAEGLEYLHGVGALPNLLLLP
jgi:protein-S-isoprenylcysteine O-methyltransferase Ste14